MHSGEQMTSSNLVLARARTGHVTAVLPADVTWPENATTGHEQIAGFNDVMIDLTSLLPDAELDILHNKAVAAGIVCLYALVIVVGSVGSLLVIVSIARSRLMWTATNVFIANLALTDLFVCAIDLPMTLHYQLTNDWVFGNAMCHVVMTTFGIVVFSSAINLALIAVDRYVLIVCPLRRRMSVSMAVAAVVATGAVAAGASAPIAVYTKHIRSRDVAPDIPWDTSYCTEEWPTVSARQLYTMSAFVCQFAVPLVVIALLYYRIFRRLRSRPVPGNGSSGGGGRTRAAVCRSSPDRTAVIATEASPAADEGYSVSMATVPPAVASRQGSRPRHSGGGASSQRGGSRRRARTNKMLVAVVVVFGITWTPFHLFEIVVEFGLNVFAGRYLKLISLAFRAVAFSSACVNPFLYGWMNDNYRTSFLTIVAPLVHRLPRLRSADGRQRQGQQASRPLRESENQPGISLALHHRLPTTRSSFYNDDVEMHKIAVGDVGAAGTGNGSCNGHSTINTDVCCVVDRSGFLCVATDHVEPVTNKGNGLNLCGCDGIATDVDNQLPTYDVAVSSVSNNDNAAAATADCSSSVNTVLTTSDDCQCRLAVNTASLLESVITDP